MICNIVCICVTCHWTQSCISTPAFLTTAFLQQEKKPSLSSILSLFPLWPPAIWHLSPLVLSSAGILVTGAKPQWGRREMLAQWSQTPPTPPCTRLLLAKTKEVFLFPSHPPSGSDSQAWLHVPNCPGRFFFLIPTRKGPTTCNSNFIDMAWKSVSDFFFVFKHLTWFYYGWLDTSLDQWFSDFSLT